jgi:hypothetical protein
VASIKPASSVGQRLKPGECDHATILAPETGGVIVEPPRSFRSLQRDANRLGRRSSPRMERLDQARELDPAAERRFPIGGGYDSVMPARG